MRGGVDATGAPRSASAAREAKGVVTAVTRTSNQRSVSGTSGKKSRVKGAAVVGERVLHLPPRML